jgi:hypothetical protein
MTIMLIATSGEDPRPANVSERELKRSVQISHFIQPLLKSRDSFNNCLALVFIEAISTRVSMDKGDAVAGVFCSV